MNRFDEEAVGRRSEEQVLLDWLEPAGPYMVIDAPVSSTFTRARRQREDGRQAARRDAATVK